MMHSCICIDREQQTKLSYLVCAWFIALENDLVWRILRKLMVEAIRVHRFVYCLGSSLAFEILIAFTVQSEMRKIVQKSNVVNFASLTLIPSSSFIRC
jgi:uncharacterized membrane protein